MNESAMGLTLHSPEGVAYHFDPGSLCLELLTTGGPGPLARFEVLHQPSDLDVWVRQSRLSPTPQLEVTELELAAARVLRDTLLTLARDRLRGRESQPEDLERVNAAAAEPPLTPLLDPAASGGRRWEPASGRRLLSTVARDAIDLFTGPYAHRIRECGADDCFLIFVDTSRPGKRRWCSMGRCGNRHKVRALRARQGEHESPEEHEGVTVMSPTGLTKDAGWEIGVSKTLAHPPRDVWDFISGREGLSCWLGGGVVLREGDKGQAYETDDGTVGEVRSFHPGDRIRLTWRPPGWEHDTTVQVAVSPSRGDEEKAVLRFHQEHLAGPEERERQRAHWRAVIASVAASLDG